MAQRLWLPGSEGPHDDFVQAVHRQIAAFQQRTGVERAFVEVELEDGARLALDSIAPEPGYGFITLRPHVGDEPDVPEELIVPLASVRRIELNRAEDAEGRFGFSLPASS